MAIAEFPVGSWSRPDDEADEGGCEIVYRYGRRSVTVYPLTETELTLLAWLPWFARRRFIRGIRESCTFDEGDAA